MIDSSGGLQKEKGMQTRRAIIASLAGTMAVIGSGSAAPVDDSGIPVAKIIPGKPALLDYGDGMKIPATKEAFFTLWEGSTFWLTFGFGIVADVEVAQNMAAKQAAGVMKFLLLTLAFAPNRLLNNGIHGWTIKDPKAHNLVIGELDLPPNPNKAVNDSFLGGGNIEISPLWNWGSSGASASVGMMRQADRHAFTKYIILKKDLSLDDVRKRAVILHV